MFRKNKLKNMTPGGEKLDAAISSSANSCGLIPLCTSRSPSRVFQAHRDHDTMVADLLSIGMETISTASHAETATHDLLSDETG